MPAISGLDAAAALDGTELVAVVQASDTVQTTAQDIADLAAASDSFTTIAVSGQSNVVADSATDTLTLAAGANITITTNATTDTVTIAAAGAADSDDITYTPTTVADWDGSADPGDVEQALDQLAERVADLEGAGPGASDADDITYTPTTVADWDGSADPGDVEQALDQLAERVTDLEGAGAGTGTKTYAVFTPMVSQPPASNFATLDTRNSIAVLDFDDTTEESTYFVGVLPEAANVASGLKVRIHWTATSATTGNVRWGAAFEAAGTDLDSDSFDTATEAHTATNGTCGIEAVTEITCTTIDSITAGTRYRLKIYRDASDGVNDTVTGDAELIAVEVRSAA